MMKMKNLVALAVAAAVMSPMAAMADNTPDNVGNVTLLGNIVANSPMWQWTVNDYPGSSLDVHASSATTVDGITSYKLDGQKFIAVSGYLPSFVPATGPAVSPPGLSDKTTLTGVNGAPIGDIVAAPNGATTFTISAQGKNVSGSDVTGKLTLLATELRGARHGGQPQGSPVKKLVRLIAQNRNSFAISGGSCFVGTSAYPNGEAAISGNADNPTPGSQSATAFEAWIAALTIADTNGNAARYASRTAEGADNSVGIQRNVGCDYQTITYYPQIADATNYWYVSAAHVLELEPTQLSFDAPISGAWSATLNVTAYQM